MKKTRHVVGAISNRDRNTFWLIGLLLIGCHVLTANAAPTNNWQAIGGIGKWEYFVNWSQGVPSLSHGLHRVAPVGGNPADVFINAETVASNGINGCLTISNLTLQGTTGPLGQPATLVMSNAGSVTPLLIANSLTVSTRGNVRVSDSVLRVNAPSGDSFFDNGNVVLNSGTIMVGVGPSAFSSGLYIGSQPGAIGALLMTGGNLIVRNVGSVENNINVGDFGAVGSMVVSNGTCLADILYIGAGLGTLTIGGGTTALRSFLDVGVGSGTGIVWMTGGQLTVTNNATFIGGLNGVGQMIVSNGAWLAREVYVGWNFGSQATLSMVGGTGVLSSFLNVGNQINATGAVYVTGGELIVTNGPFNVGIGGVGETTVSNGTLRTEIMNIGTNFAGHGTLTVAGGTNLVTLLSIGKAGGTGTVWITGGQLLANVPLADIRAGFGGVGRLTVSNGTMLATTLRLGGGVNVSDGLPGNGIATILGGTNRWNNPVIGGFGSTGSVWVSGGELAVTNSDSTVEISNGGVGQITVSNGTVLLRNVEVGQTVFSAIGTNRGSGTLTFVGGTTRILSGGEPGNFGGLKLGRSFYPIPGTGTVWLTGGQLMATDGTNFVGRLGVGFMTVSNGTLVASNIHVGAFFGAQGTLRISGGASDVFSELILGNQCGAETGMLVVAGGLLNITNATGNALLDIRSGTFTMSGGTVAINQLVITNDCGRFVHTGGTLSITATNLSGSFDADGDGIPNGYDPYPLDPSNASADSDGDGLTDLQEYLAGTNPTNSASFFGVTAITPAGNDLRVTWMTGLGKTNALERSPGAADGSYSNNFTGIFTVTNTVGTTTNYTDIGGATNKPARFYRVRLVP
jgi:hypothetical protein